MISTHFITYASNTLTETYSGLTGSQIAEICSAYATDFNTEIPYSQYPFPDDLPNKRTALKENLKMFNPKQQFQIIKELCEHPIFKENRDVKDLKIKLITQYGSLNNKNNAKEINISLIEETQHWLAEYPEALIPYEECLEKHSNKIHTRNLLDDLRLSLEVLLKDILSNNKPLEKQNSDLGKYMNDRNSSKELNNMFIKLVDYFSKYQNTYVKHDYNVNENEIDIIIEIASSFMKHIIKIK